MDIFELPISMINVRFYFIPFLFSILIVQPTHVEIMAPIGSYLSDELKTEVTCRAYGSKPYSLITWILNGINITNQR